MRILALDTSSKAASAALLEEDRLLGERFLNNGLTHSQTILPLVQSLLEDCRLTLEEVDRLAVTCGPGSFTGLRIALSAVKGMAFAGDTPCVGVSTLEALAYNLAGMDLLVCPVMDARCKQVYTALFEAAPDGMRRLWEDAALPIDELHERLKSFDRPIFLVGDGAQLCYNKDNNRLYLAPATLQLQRAGSVALCARQKMQEEGAVSAAQLLPQYLRLPQAERELREKQKERRSHQ